MLNQVLRQALVFLGAACAATALFVLVEIGSPFFQRCVDEYRAHNQSADTDKSPQHPGTIIVSYAICTGRFSDRHAGGITALASILIAAFTATLWVTSGRQVRLGRAEFLSTHRPKIIVHSVEIAYDAAPDGKDATIGASVVYFNVGDTPARITEINAKITRRILPLQSGLGVGIGVRLARLPVPKEMIESGHPNVLAVHSEHTLEGERFAEKAAQDRGRGGGLVCIGQIVYEDGGRTRRETGFCRRLDTKEARWVSIDNPEYEYAY